VAALTGHLRTWVLVAGTGADYMTSIWRMFGLSVSDGVDDKIYLVQPEALTDNELNRCVLPLAHTFVNRWDMYPQQLDSGSYVTIHQGLTSTHLFEHLQGEITLGTYLLDPQARARFIVLDADTEEHWQGLKELATSLLDEGAAGYLERSRRGGHLWLFLAERTPATHARAFGKGLLAAHSLSEIELYPKQDRLTSGPGSLIRLPFGVHRKSGQRYGFYTPLGDPLAPTIRGQIYMLIKPQHVPETVFEAYRSISAPEPQQQSVEAFEGLNQPIGETLSEQIKSRITVREFVSQYVQLSDSGYGKCPFHNDAVASFGVNDRGNYWSCFAGCGGGSIIDFYMRYHDVDFTTAVRQLKELLW